MGMLKHYELLGITSANPSHWLCICLDVDHKIIGLAEAIKECRYIFYQCALYLDQWNILQHLSLKIPFYNLKEKKEDKR